MLSRFVLLSVLISCVMDSEKAKHVGAVVTPQLACVLLANILIKKLGSARTFAEQVRYRVDEHGLHKVTAVYTCMYLQCRRYLV